MNREHLHLLMNRAIDGVATPAEREELARALKADPLLRGEFEDHESVHASTLSLFRQLALHEDFSKRVMRRIQNLNVPADSEDDSVRLPSVRPLGARAARVVSLHRARVRIYAAIAFVSAAAALILALGVITGAFSRNVDTSTDDTRAAEGSQGVPDTGNPKPHRDSHPQPLPIDGAKEGAQPERDSTIAKDGEGEVSPLPKPAPREPEQPQPKPDDVIDNPDSKPGEKPEPAPEQPANPDKPEGPVVQDEPANPGDTVGDTEKEKPAPTQPKESEKTGTREKLGQVLVLGGRVDLVGSDGALTRLADDGVIYSGDRLRTKYSAVVMLQLAGGDVTLGKETQISLESGSALRLEEYDGKERGLIAVDRSAAHTGDSFQVNCGEYSMYLLNGAAVLERKRKGLLLSKAVGFATLTHDVYGSILLPADSGYEADVEFGKEYSPPKAKLVQLPAWSGETRAQAVMLALSGPIADRKFSSSRERSWLNSNLPGKLDNLMTFPTTTDVVVNFLVEALKREQLDGVSLVKMAGEVEIAYSEVSELSPEVITHHAARAAMVAESYDQWREYFYRLMRPPVEGKTPTPTPVPSPDCPNDPKYKRVDEPPRKTIKTPEKQPDKKDPETPAETPEE